MVRISTWFRYFAARIDYAMCTTRSAFVKGLIDERGAFELIKTSLLYGRLTMMHWEEAGQGMWSIFRDEGRGTLLARKFCDPDARRFRVGDVVLVSDPNCEDKLLVRRLAAIGEHVMLSSDSYDEPFVLRKSECWVLVDNKKMNAKDAYDSRTFGPVMIKDILGRPMYCLRSPADHSIIWNSLHSESKDSAILEVELDIEEMVNSVKT